MTRYMLRRRGTWLATCLLGQLWGCEDGSGAGDPVALPPTAVATQEAGVASPREPEPAAVQCGKVEPWDGDGDGVSDALEANQVTLGATSFALGRCDRDPSRPRGEPGQGRLVGGVNLYGKGRGYIQSRGTDEQDTDDWSTLSLAHCIEAVGRDILGKGLKIGITDLSREKGGYFRPHVTHQNGLDADVRYPTRKRDGGPCDLAAGWGRAIYDRSGTLEVLRSFARNCDVDRIYYDRYRTKIRPEEVPGADLRHIRGHANHFHVRLRKPS